MPRRITLKPHLTTDELYRRYRACRQPQEKLRWRALYLISHGEFANHAARRVGRSSGWITALARRYNERGAKAVPDARGEVAPGRRPRLDKEAAQALDLALRSEPADDGLWTAPKVARWIAERTGTNVNQSTAWRVMRRLGFTLQVPRPKHRRAATTEEQAAFKKSLANRSPTSSVRTQKRLSNPGHRTKRV
jgi:Transposase and inactivated derivatives